MKATQTIISTLRDAPNDALIASHQLMMRTGMLRKLGNGLYSYMPFGLRSLRKIENIIREELDASGLLEIKPTVVVPGDIWRESGRWDKMSGEMLTAKTRTGQDMVVSPTAEEAVTALIREGLSSYKQLPIIVYQINTKYRDEIRPRYGVMRGREFTMMDAYSFDADDASLNESYEKCAAAYRRIFKRLGLSTISVKADTGAMGGSGSEEFMVESEVGDDTLILCPKCGYAANVEKASCKADVPVDNDGNPQVASNLPLEEVATPNVLSIADMERFFNSSPKRFIKALIYRVVNSSLDLENAPGGKNLNVVEETSGKYYPLSYFCVLIRADLEVNEAKLKAALKASEVCLANDEEVLHYSGTTHGFVGPMGAMRENGTMSGLEIPILADLTVLDMHDAITGGGKKDIHVKHVEPNRDFKPFLKADVRTVVPGDCCAECGEKLYSRKGNELGHIFKLGDKYTKSMNVTYLDTSGKPVTPIMGCYGIGVDRTLASIIEEHHDEDGIIWTMSTAPYQVVVIPIKYDGEMKKVADKIYSELTDLGVDVLLDDRSERPGVKFTDADLIGYPIRIVVGEKNLPNVEFKLRSEKDATLVSLDEASKKAVEIVREELKKLNA